MLRWNIYGGLVGLGLYLVIPKLPILKKNPYIRRYRYSPFIISFVVLSYHGYKLKELEKRKGIRELAKNPDNLLPKDDAELSEGNKGTN